MGGPPVKHFVAVGDVFGFLTVVSEPFNNAKSRRHVTVRCVCGTTYDAAVGNLVHGVVRSCGCQLARLSFETRGPRIKQGEQFGDLTAVADSFLRFEKESDEIRTQFVIARCVCGTEKEFNVDGLLGDRTRSCGCLARKVLIARNTTHGLTGSPLYNTWQGMRRRCGDEKFISYSTYGGRGIRVCAEWQNFAAFHEWAMSNGYAEGTELHREDNDGNYEPGNCVWMPMPEHRKLSARNRAERHYAAKAISESPQTINI